MFQTIIRDPGGNELIRVYPNLCDSRNTIVNGSVLIVPAGTKAFVSINGELSPILLPGRYNLFTQESPFFVRLRNLMTHGEAPVDVSAFFISDNKTKFFQIGTGEIPFREQRFQLTLKAMASCALAYSISQPRRILEKLIGTYSSSFSSEDLELCLQQLVITPIKQSIARTLSNYEVTQFNSLLSSISEDAFPYIHAAVDNFGIKCERFEITGINIPDSQINRLYQMEQDFAKGKTRTDLEIDNLNRVWSGDVNQRTIAEMMTGIPSRGSVDPSTSSASNINGNREMLPMMAQMMMMAHILPNLREPLSTMNANINDIFNNTHNSSHEDTSTSDAPPPIPSKTIRCTSCNKAVRRGLKVCPNCGQIL